MSYRVIGRSQTALFAFAACALLFSAPFAFAQSTTSPVTPGPSTISAPAAPGKVSSDTPTTEEKQEKEVQLRPFLLTLPRDHLLGDWGGLRTAMENAGITPTFNYVSNFAGNPTGGKNQGFTYCDNTGLALLFDLHKIASIDDATFLLSASQRFGTSLTKEYIDNTFNVQQVYGTQTFHLIDVAYEQKVLNGKLDYVIGRICAGDDFLVSPYNYLFMQNGFDGNPVGIFLNAPGMNSYPHATWGLRVKVKPTDRLYVMGGVYNGDPNIRDNPYNGINMSMHGPVFAMGEMGYRVNGLPGDSQYLGNYKLGGWYDNSVYTDYNSVGLLTAPTMQRGNYGLYAMFDQVILPFAEPGSNRGLGIFGSFLVSPDQSVSQLPYFFTAGTAFRGIFDSRPKDTAGFGVLFGEFGHDLRQSQQRLAPTNPGQPIQTNETVFEWTYRFNLHQGAIFVQPDVQYILRPGAAGQFGNAVVLGAQLGVNF